ncbi:rRNA maturation RNase YbeY [Roseivirga sp.]|uniref:rRNA maturation RNase YbeY n=1 Tax=Roseivirga sp. TaxID=1964215 RepID=UPI003B8E7F73
MPAINFFNEDISFTLRNKRKLRAWLHQISLAQGKEIIDLNYIYCSDNYLLQINKEYLNHDYFTDIITFDNNDGIEETIIADLYISIDRVRDNAKTLDTYFDNELHRVMVHGLLHLLGQNDKTEAEQKEMTKREEASLSLLQI